MHWIEGNFRNSDNLLFVPVTFPNNIADGILINNQNANESVRYIQKANSKKAYLSGITRFDILNPCTSLQHLYIELKLPSSFINECKTRGNKSLYTFDCSPLYHLSNLLSLEISAFERPNTKIDFFIDLSNFRKLQYYSGDYTFIQNIESSTTLKSLILHKYKCTDLTNFSLLSNLDTLELTFSKINTLNGLQYLSNLKCLYLKYNKNLSDISSLREIKNTLTALRIENCPNITDFSTLKGMEHLELLELSGSNHLPDLSFLSHMPKLKTFIFSMNVCNGNLSPCQSLQYVYSEKNRRHYNLRDAELPKGVFYHGNESVEEWRRLE